MIVYSADDSLKLSVEDENQEPPSSLVVDGVGMITRLNKAYAFLILSWSAMLMMPTAKAWPLIDILDLHGQFLYNHFFDRRLGSWFQTMI